MGGVELVFSPHQKHSAVWHIVLQSQPKNISDVADINWCAQIVKELALSLNLISFLSGSQDTEFVPTVILKEHQSIPQDSYVKHEQDTYKPQIEKFGNDLVKHSSIVFLINPCSNFLNNVFSSQGSAI